MRITRHVQLSGAARITTAIALVVTLLAQSSVYSDPGPPTTDSPQSRDPRIQAVIDKAIAARDLASKSIPRACGQGSYKVTVTDKDGNVRRKESARFHMAFDHECHFIQFRYSPHARHEDWNCYARVVLSDGETIYESLFPGRSPDGDGTIAQPHAFAIDQMDKGSLQPLVEIPPAVHATYDLLGLMRTKPYKLSLRDEGKLQILQAEAEDGRSTIEYWINPAESLHVVRTRLLVNTGKAKIATTDVERQWAKQGELWYVKRCAVTRKSRRDGEVPEIEKTELVFDKIEPNVRIPPEVFTVHALALPPGARIFDKWTSKERDRYEFDPNFDFRKVERVVGKLPTAISSP